MKVLFLYTEIAGYFLACVEALMREHDAEVCLVRWPVNKEAPFEFDFGDRLQVRVRDEFATQAALDAFCLDFAPDVAYITGWMDRGYLRTARLLRRRGTPVVMGLDTKWRGDARQRLATLLAPLALRPSVSHAWVPFTQQYEYARRLGFGHDRILLGYYCADTGRFGAAQAVYASSKAVSYPHNFLYVGRFVAVKGLDTLCAAFLQASEGSDWTLTLVGTGVLRDAIPDHPRIMVRDFVQPRELPALAAGAGCFVLPSHFEPWGVVLHEFAAAGLPLVATDEVGAAAGFLRDGYNGFTCRAKDQGSLATALGRVMALPDAQLARMGTRSHELARQLTTESWAATLLSILR